MKRIIRDVIEIVDGNGEIHRPENARVTVETESETGQVSNGLFCKVWMESGIERLEDVEIGFLVRIMKYVDHRDNTIRKNGEVMTVKEMAGELGKEYTRLSRMVSSLVEKRVMGKHSTEIVEYVGRRKTVYSINPYIMCRGKMVNKRIKEFYNIG